MIAAYSLRAAALLVIPAAVALLAGLAARLYYAEPTSLLTAVGGEGRAFIYVHAKTPAVVVVEWPRGQGPGLALVTDPYTGWSARIAPGVPVNVSGGVYLVLANFSGQTPVTVTAEPWTPPAYSLLQAAGSALLASGALLWLAGGRLAGWGRGGAEGGGAE